MTAISISRNAQAALQLMQWIRNGKVPSAEIQNRLSTMVGYAAAYRTKCVFHAVGGLVGTGEVSLVPASLATRERWNFAFHTGPYASFLYIRFEIAPQNNGAATDPYCTLAVQNTSGTLVGTGIMHGGSSSGSYADVPINFTGGVTHLVGPSGEFIFLNSDTEYTGTFSDVGFARLHSASVWEVSLSPDTANGYVPNNIAVGAPVFDADRDNVRTMARLLHKRSGMPVFHWCTDLDSAATSLSPGEDTGIAAITLAPVALSATGTLSGGFLAKTLADVTLSATGTAAYFFVYPSASDPAPAHNTSTTMTATVNTNGVAQTNGIFACLIGPRVTSDTSIVLSVSTTDLDGWTQSIAWTQFVTTNYWYAQFTRASLSASLVSNLQFSVTIGSSAFAAGQTITFTTDGNVINGVLGTGTDPQTDQAMSPASTPVSVTVS